MSVSALNEDQNDKMEKRPRPARVPSSVWTIRLSVKDLSLQAICLSFEIGYRLFRGDHLLRLPSSHLANF